MNYLSQKESKLMYLIFMINNQGVPVLDIYENSIKKIPTEWFNDFLNSGVSEFK